MNMLIVEENMCAECRQNIAFAYSSQEESFVNMYIPFPKSFYSTLMGGCVARGY